MPSNAQQLEIELLRTRERVRTLEGVVKLQSEALKESTKLLLKSRPPRPAIPHDRKLMVASEQGWRCAGDPDECVMHQLSDGLFTIAGGLFECDHIEPWHLSFRTVGQPQCLCAACHNAKSRRERVHALEQEQEEQAKEQAKEERAQSQHTEVTPHSSSASASRDDRRLTRSTPS